MDYIIKVAHNAAPTNYQRFCRITEYNGGDEEIDEICKTLTDAEFRDCRFMHEDALEPPEKEK